MLSGDHSQVSLGEWKYIRLSPGITSVLATVAIAFMIPLDDDQDGLGKRLTASHRWLKLSR